MWESQTSLVHELQSLRLMVSGMSSLKLTWIAQSTFLIIFILNSVIRTGWPTAQCLETQGVCVAHFLHYWHWGCRLQANKCPRKNFLFLTSNTRFRFSRDRGELINMWNYTSNWLNLSQRDFEFLIYFPFSWLHLKIKF